MWGTFFTYMQTRYMMYKCKLYVDVYYVYEYYKYILSMRAQYHISCKPLWSYIDMEVPWKNGSLWSAPFWDPAKYNLHAKMAYMILQYDTMIRDEWYDMIQNMPWHFCWSNYNNSKPTLVVTCPGLGKSSDVFEFPAPIWSVGCDRAGCALDETRMNENS